MPPPTPAELGEAFARVGRLQDELPRRERAISLPARRLARGLADMMAPGDHLHRRYVSLHAFPVGGIVCLVAAYFEEEKGGYRYRYAVLYGGEAAKRALRTVQLDPGDSDEPGPNRRVALATYADYEDFIERLPIFIADVTRDLEECVRKTTKVEGDILEARRQLAKLKRRIRGTPQP